MANSHDQVDARNLLHEHCSVCQEDTAPGLHVVSLEELTPFVLAVLLLQLKRFEDLALLFLDSDVVWLAIVDVAEDLQCLLATAVGIEVAWGLGQAENEHDNDLTLLTWCQRALKRLPLATHHRENHLTSDRQPPSDAPRLEAHALLLISQSLFPDAYVIMRT
jgi:hypothetical protein